MPSILRAQGAGVKVGILHPVSGALSYSGQQGRLGATMAIEEINAAGGIKGLGKIDAVLGDAQSTPEGGTAEVEKMNSAGVACIVGGYASNICLATTQAAARYDLPYIVDVGVTDTIVTPRAEEHVPLRPRLRRDRQDGARQSRRHQRQGRQAGQDGHDRARGLRCSAPVSPSCSTPSCRRKASRCWRLSRIRRRRAISTTSCSRSRRRAPDIVIPANYYNEYVLLARTMQQQKVRPKGRSIRCSAARRPPTSSSRNSPRPRNTSWTAITGSIRAMRRRRR